MAEPITHLEQTIAGQVKPVTHLEQVIAEYSGGDINEQLEAGTNIVIEPTADGKAKISASGEVSSEDTYARGEISDHKADKANPHEVTAAQVGLGNVNNTSDANKPVSTATQAALDLKANLTDIPTVNDATITIQKNGTKVDDFTLNAASGKNINITVPTTAADVSALPASTKYAGASTAGGSATSAAKLDTASAGSTTQPVYFANGVPTATGYSVAKSVPADAVFTDTTYTFEGTYNASTNKAATMADIKDGKLTGYAQGSGNVAATDKVIEAIGKVEKKADDNTTNILSKIVYGTCSTAASTADKVVDVPQGFVLTVGCIIGVFWNVGNTAGNVTLNVGGTGAKAIAYNNYRPYTSTASKVTGAKNMMFYYMYDGTYWVFITISQILNSMAQSEASEGTSTTERLISAKVLSDTIDEKLVPVNSNILSLNGTSQTADLDTLVYGGRYMVLNDSSNPVANAPFTGWQTLDVYMSSDTSPISLVIQICTSMDTGLPRKARRRTYVGGGNYSWGSWST